MEIQCTSCGATFEANERTQSTVQCPYCGSHIKLEDVEKSCSASRKYQRIIPFKISEQEAVDIMLNLLVSTDGVPTDVFEHLNGIVVERYFLPMYMMNGEIEAPWNAMAVERRSREVRDSSRSGGYRTEYYYERWPINGYATSAYWLLSSANTRSQLPHVLREYGKVIEYTDLMAHGSISENVRELNYPLPEDCKEVNIDTDDQTVFNTSYVVDYVRQLGINAALSQVPTSYENFRCTPRWTNQVFELTGVAVYYIRFNYRGETYEFCIDGLGLSYYQRLPQDHDAIESLRKSIRNKRIYTWLLCLFGIAMPLIGSFGITRWPIGLLLAFIAMPIAMLVTLLILIYKERKAILSREQEQREYARRVYLGLDTSDVDGNATTKLRVVTNILLWIGLAVDIAAIIISLTIRSPYATLSEASYDNITANESTQPESQESHDQAEEANVNESPEPDIYAVDAQHEAEEAERQRREQEQAELQRREQERDWMYGTWTCRIVKEVPNSYIGSVSYTYKLIITDISIQVFDCNNMIYNGPYTIENNQIIYYLEDGSRKYIPIDSASHRLRLYGSNYYTKS